MGFYTQLKLSVTLSEQAPLEVIKKLCDGTMEQELFTLKFGKLPNFHTIAETPELPISHEFGKSTRWDQIFHNATFNEENRKLKIDCDIKAYDNIYEHLIDWLKPFIEMGHIKSKGEDQDDWYYHYN